MLELDEGRIGFAEALRPPVDYEVAFAVGTTYSLDLRALLGLCIPLGLGFEPETLDSINPVSLFAALQRLRDKLVVYCDKGGIKADLPANPRSAELISLLEGVVHQVHVNTGNPEVPSSFHPKVWVVEYKALNGEDHMWRLLVMSRNLTFDTSWDTVVQLDGKPGDANACSEHVADFLDFIAEGSDRIDTERDNARKRGSHTARVHQLAQRLREVKFVVDDRSFEAVDFLPFGPKWQGGSDLLLDARDCELLTYQYRSALVVSPFLSDSSDSPLLRMASNRSGEAGRYVLLSREDSLNKVGVNVRDAYECYCPTPMLADVELDDEDGVDAADYSNLHAKLYFTEDRARRRTLYIGSLNASYNGMVNNVEALIKLDVRKGYHTFDSVLKPLIERKGKDMAPFSPYVPFDSPDHDAVDEQVFRRSFRVGAKCVGFRRVVVRKTEDDALALDVSLRMARAGKHCSGTSFALRPLLHGEERAIELGARHDETLCFAGLSSRQISAMFVLMGRDEAGHSASCVLVCPHDRFDDAGFSLESRSKLLLSEILSSDSGALAQYLAHVFDLPESAYSIGGEAAASSVGAPSRKPLVPSGLYERLLDMADTSPEIFDRTKV